jgi:hypothetical protein
MDVKVSIKSVQFVFPTKNLQEALITTGAIDLHLRMYESWNAKSLSAEQKSLSKQLSSKHLALPPKEERKFHKYLRERGIAMGSELAQREFDLWSGKRILELNKTMKVRVQKKNFEVFLCQFRDILDHDFNRGYYKVGAGTKKSAYDSINKRYLLFPMSADLNLSQFGPVNKKLEHKTVNSLRAGVNSIVMKTTLSDMEILKLISTHQSSMYSRHEDYLKSLEEFSACRKWDTINNISNLLAQPDKKDLSNTSTFLETSGNHIDTPHKSINYNMESNRENPLGRGGLAKIEEEIPSHGVELTPLADPPVPVEIEDIFRIDKLEIDSLQLSLINDNGGILVPVIEVNIPRFVMHANISDSSEVDSLFS